MAGDEDGKGIAFLILGFAAAGIAEDPTHLEEAQGFCLLAGVALGGGHQPGDDARAHDCVILAEWGFHSDEIAVLERAEREDIGELGFGNEFDRLALIKAERGQAAAEYHIGIVCGSRFAGGGEGAEQAGRDIGEAVDTGDFLREIDVTGEVLAERWDLPLTGWEFREAETG